LAEARADLAKLYEQKAKTEDSEPAPAEAGAWQDGLAELEKAAAGGGLTLSAEQAKELVDKLKPGPPPEGDQVMAAAEEVADNTVPSIKEAMVEANVQDEAQAAILALKPEDQVAVAKVLSMVGKDNTARKSLGNVIGTQLAVYGPTQVVPSQPRTSPYPGGSTGSRS